MLLRDGNHLDYKKNLFKYHSKNIINSVCFLKPAVTQTHTLFNIFFWQLYRLFSDLKISYN